MRQDVRNTIIFTVLGSGLVCLVVGLPRLRHRLHLERGLREIGAFAEFNEGLGEHVRSLFEGAEQDAVLLSMSKFDNGTDLERRRAALNVLRCFPEESLSQFKKAFRSARRPVLSVRRALSGWAFTTESSEGLSLAIDNLIEDVELAVDPGPGDETAVARLCDTAFGAGRALIEGTAEVFGPLLVEDAPEALSYAIVGDPREAMSVAVLAAELPEVRDENLRAFRLWWEAKKPFLEWSPERRKFVLNRDAWRARVPVAQWAQMSEQERHEALEGPERPYAAEAPEKDIFTASARGGAGRVKELLESNPNLAGLRDDDERTPLHAAAQCGSPEAALALMDAQADPMVRDREGLTPLHLAAFFGQRDVVELLLERGADPDAQDERGWTPLHWAAAYGQREVVGLLLDGGAELEARTATGRTPLHGAVGHVHKGVAEVLVARGAQVDAADKSGLTPLSLIEQKLQAGPPTPPASVEEVLELLRTPPPG